MMMILKLRLIKYWCLQELYTYNVRQGDYFVLDEKLKLRQLSKSSRGANSSSNGVPNSCSSSASSSCGSFSFGGGSFSPAPRGYTSLQARSGQQAPNFGGHSPVSSGESPPRRDRRSSGGNETSSPGARPAAKNLFGHSSTRKRFGEFHHSKVFHDHQPAN